MVVKSAFSGGRFEVIGSYARAKRVGAFVYVSGTAAIDENGEVFAPGDSYAQSIFIFKKIETALTAVGAELRHVVRSTAFLPDLKTGLNGFVQAHGEVFKDINPTTTGVEAGLTRPGLMVEIQVDAIIHDTDGNLIG